MRYSQGLKRIVHAGYYTRYSCILLKDGGLERKSSLEQKPTNKCNSRLSTTRRGSRRGDGLSPEFFTEVLINPYVFNSYECARVFRSCPIIFQQTTRQRRSILWSIPMATHTHAHTHATHHQHHPRWSVIFSKIDLGLPSSIHRKRFRQFPPDSDHFNDYLAVGDEKYNASSLSSSFRFASSL